MPDVTLRETDDGPALSNGIVELLVHLNKGTFSVRRVDGAVALNDAAFSVSLRDGPSFTSRGTSVTFEGEKAVDDAHGAGLSITLLRETDEGEPELTLTATVYEREPFAVLQAEIENKAPAPLRVQSFSVLDGAVLDLGGAAATRFYKHGWQSWSPSLVLDLAGEDPVLSPPVIGPGTQPSPAPGRFVSDLVAAVAEPDAKKGVVAGFVSAADQFSHVVYGREGPTLSALSYADGIELPPRRHLASERLLVEPTIAPTEALCRYGDALGREMEALHDNHVASGWCSWYYYWQGVSEEACIANLEAAATDGYPFEYFQIDDGYQSEIGDWLTVNDKFPHGMKWLAERIHARGFKAGLWLAPFLAGARSRLFAEHRDWFVRFSTGDPAIATVNWNQPCFALDITHPEVQVWLRDVFRTITHEWGYDYVKIDFVFAAAVDGLRHDRNVTRAQAYRRGLEIVRETVGNRFVLACGNPMGPSVGLVEAARIGPDVAPFWHPTTPAGARDSMSHPSALNSIRNIISRFWMHGRLWANDPDVLVARDTETALTPDEVRTLATAIGLTGGMVLDSDNLPKLTAERRELLLALLPVYGQSAIPLDFFETPDLPRLLQLDCGTHTVLALFNWSSEAAVVSAPLPAGRHHAFEFWEREYVGVVSDAASLTVPAHGCRLLRLTPDAGRPQVVGSTFHVLQGALEIASEAADGDGVSVTMRPVGNKNGALFVARDGGVSRFEVYNLTEPRTETIR